MINKGQAAKLLLDNAIAGILGGGLSAGVAHLGANAYNAIAPTDWEVDPGDMARYAALGGAGSAIWKRTMRNIGESAG